MKELFDWVRVPAVGIFGIITQMTSWDMFFKVSLGFLTCCYVTAKLAKFLWSWRGQCCSKSRVPEPRGDKDNE